MGGSAGGGSGDSTFARNGSASQTSYNVVPSYFQALLDNQLINRPRSTGGDAYIGAQMNRGLDAGGTYQNDTAQAYEDRVLRALNLSKNSSQAVLAPVGRGESATNAQVISTMGQERAGEVRAQENQDRELGMRGALGLNTQQSQDKSVDTTALMALANLLFPRSNTSAENFAGQGAQASSAYSFGGALCCFIFLESFHGVLPSWVRECRDEFAQESSLRRHGYRKMSGWLVPAMRVSPKIRFLVWHTMVKPLTLWGGYYKRVDGYERFWYLKPVVKFWFGVWALLGV